MAQRILVVDDERHIVRLIQVNLERAGYEVVTADSGKDVLEKVDAEKPNLVILDELMPYMGGFEVFQNLQKNPATRDVPSILLQPKRADGNVYRGNAPLFCLMKPFHATELVAMVGRILSDQDGSETNAAIPPPTPVAPTQPFSWWRKMNEVWRKIGF